MSWRNSVMNDKMRFINQILDGKSMSKVCRDFDISRKTGYKVWKHYKESGSISPRSSRPFRFANQLPEDVESLILDLKKEKPHWGAPKIREIFKRKYSDPSCLIRLPACPTARLPEKI